MRFTCILIGILCLLCLFNHGNTTLDAQQTTSIQIEQPYLDPNWRPEAGSSLTFEIRVTVPADFSSGTLIAELQNVTHYAGKSGNVTDPDDRVVDGEVSAAADLRLSQTTGWSGSESQLSHTLSGTTTTQTMTLQVDCEDYAAYGELVLTASGSDGASTPVTYTSNTVTVKIPRDENGNKIADGWQNDGAKNYGHDDDNDSGPASNSNYGDGITVIDEYRGLTLNGTWTATDPNGWDIFVQLSSTLTDPTDPTDTGYSTDKADALPMTVHDVSPMLVDCLEGAVYSSGIGSHEVCAIRLIAYSGEDFGGCDSATSAGCMYAGPPDIYSTGYINLNVIQRGIDSYSDDMGITINKIDYVNAVIAHEIGHAVNLGHCPNIDCPDCFVWGLNDWPSQYVTQFAAHHDSDYDLVPNPGGYHPQQTEYGGTLPDRGYSSERGVHIRQIEDINGDGVINILDLNAVASKYNTNLFDKDYNILMDVNNDESINILDLVQVASAFGTASEFPHLPEDVNDDRVVNILDLIIVASNFGESGTHVGDINCDGTVDILDLVRVTAVFGSTVLAPEE